LLDPTTWYGYQGDDVAYAVRMFQFTDLSLLETRSVHFGLNGTVGTIVAGGGAQDMLAWTDPNASKRPGTFVVTTEKPRVYLRDFWVGRDLGEITSQFTLAAGGAHARLNVTVADPAGSTTSSIVGARTAVLSATSGQQISLLVADAAGKAKVDLPTGSYKLAVGAPGRVQ